MTKGARDKILLNVKKLHERFDRLQALEKVKQFNSDSGILDVLNGNIYWLSKILNINAFLGNWRWRLNS